MGADQWRRAIQGKLYMLIPQSVVGRGREDQLHIFETALQGQRPSLNRSRFCAQDRYQSTCTSGDSADVNSASSPAAANLQRIYPQIPCSTSQPVADPSVPQGWETIDETDIQQVRYRLFCMLLALPLTKAEYCLLSCNSRGK